MKKIVFVLSLMFFVLGSVCSYADEVKKDKDINKLLTGLTIVSEGTAKAQMVLTQGIAIIVADSFWNDLFILKNRTVIRHIDLYMYCLGGDMFAGFAIIEQIKKARKEGFEFTAYASGAIGSMAIPIYASCNTRVAYPSTIFMVHPATLGSAKMMMTGADLKSQTDLHDMSQNLYVSTLANYTKLSKEEWLEKTEKDTWFSAEQAKEWGLVDEIK